MMRLCFGTFAQILRLCKLKKVSNRLLVGTMTRTIDPNCRYIEKGNDTPVSRLLSCDANFPNSEINGGSGAIRKPGESLSNVYQLSLKMQTKDITQKFQDSVLQFIDEDKKALAVLALLDIIRKDSLIDEENKIKFEKYIGKTKNTLLSQREFVLEDFLAGVFLYTVVSVINTDGKDCVKEIDEEYITSFIDKKELITFLEHNKDSESYEESSLSEEKVNFDDDFDVQVVKLDRALRRLNESIVIGEENQGDVVIYFVDDLNNTVSQGKLIKNANGDLKDFIDRIKNSAARWKNTDFNGCDPEGIGNILDDIKDAMNMYLNFRQDYLLSRKINLSQGASTSEIMIAIFKQTILDYRIIDFANNDPCVSLSMDLEMDVEYFVDVIKKKIILPFAHYQKDRIFVKINEFNQIIDGYNAYLSLNMYPINNKRMDMYIPLYGENDFEYAREFEAAVEKHRRQLDKVYGEICDGETLFIYSINEVSTIPFINYISKLKEKYSMIKTLLYSDQPRMFYDFYVCNDIERRIPVHSKFGSQYKTTTIENVTIKSISDCSRFVILSGTGGLGKSMMMRHLLLDSIQCYDEMGIIPVFIPLKDFDETVNNLFDYAYEKLESIGGGISDIQFQEILNKGLCLLLFDGLDEIRTSHANRFEQELERFTDKYPCNYFIISSRPYQTFISYSRFTVLRLKPFSKIQAVELIENLEFRPDEPIIKEKFLKELDHRLYWSHREFTENPLLLTIMLMTFEQFAEVPSKMHIFYREAFLALSQKHDASKGAYKRTLRTGLSSDKLADYFAEICSRSYYDEKFELSETEFENYYYNLKEREKVGDEITTADDFLYDLCSNMCLLYFEGGKYHFTHRSFQEYFCALYFSRQKDKNLENIGEFFENKRSRTFGDKTFNMMYDMIPEKVEEYIFIPFLKVLLDKCDEGDGYWTFIDIMHPHIIYEKGETNEFILNEPESYIFEFIMKEKGISNMAIDFDYLPHIDSLVVTEYGYVEDDDGSDKLVNLDDLGYEYRMEYGEPEAVGWILEFDISEILKKPLEYKELLDVLNRDDFELKLEYTNAREYYQSLIKKQIPKGNSLFDLF